MNDDDQQAFHADQLLMIRESVEAIKEAHDLGLSEERCMAIAAMAGIAGEVSKELHPKT